MPDEKHGPCVMTAAVALALACALNACRMSDVRTVTVQVPQMKNAQCEKIISATLGKADGVDPNSIKFGRGTVTVTYDSMKLAIKNIEFVIAGAGFDADEIAASPEARAKLSPECK